jgi:hypothetical protein
MHSVDVEPYYETVLDVLSPAGVARWKAGAGLKDPPLTGWDAMGWPRFFDSMEELASFGAATVRAVAGIHEVTAMRCRALLDNRNAPRCEGMKDEFLMEEEGRARLGTFWQMPRAEELPELPVVTFLRNAAGEGAYLQPGDFALVADSDNRWHVGLVTSVAAGERAVYTVGKFGHYAVSSPLILSGRDAWLLAADSAFALRWLKAVPVDCEVQGARIYDLIDSLGEFLATFR